MSVLAAVSMLRMRGEERPLAVFRTGGGGGGSPTVFGTTPPASTQGVPAPVHFRFTGGSSSSAADVYTNSHVSVKYLM